MRKEDATRFFTEAYEVRDEYRGESLYNLKPRNELVKKIQKMGHKKLLSLKLDAEEVLGYTNLFIYEALLEYDGELYDDNMNDYVSLYCYDMYNKLSRDNGINYDYYYDKRSGKYERVATCEYNEQCEVIEAEKTSNNSVHSFITIYISEEYLTPKQIEYCNAVLEYGPSKGKGIYDMSGNLLYTKQQANYYNNEIRARLAQYLVQNGQ